MSELKKVESGIWKDTAGNYYEEETVLRFRVFSKYKEIQNAKWMLVSSHSTLESAEKDGGGWIGIDQSCIYKIVDNGKPSTIKRLIY